ncbi:hypothetical protein Bpla01_01330 [Burkholderia plantarii]|nr:hypothetical protein Bpla01_01330 [Burkholderia plantarii]
MGNGEILLSIPGNVRVAKDVFAAMARGDRQGPLAPCAGDIAWIMPGKPSEWIRFARIGGHSRSLRSLPPTPTNQKKCLGPEGSGAEANRVSITLFGERVRSTV